MPKKISKKIKINEIQNDIDNNIDQDQHIIQEDFGKEKLKNYDTDQESIDNESVEELIKEPTNIPRDIFIPKNKLFDPIGILDPNGKNLNPLTKKEYQNLYSDDLKLGTYKNMADKYWTILPMYEDEIKYNAIEKIYDNQVILIVSGTGSGKTVLTPKYVLHVLNYQGRIAITNPKRLPSNDNANFAAKTLDVKLGEEVGLKYRNSKPNEYSVQKSKLIYCTDGYILGRLKSNPLLPDFDCVIIDEAHERGVNIDLLLLKLKQLVILRPEFKLVIMSATISQEIFENYFPKSRFKFTIVYGGGKTFKPVKEYFLNEIPFLKQKLIYQTSGKKSILSRSGELKIQDDKLYLDPMVDIIIHILKNNIPGDILAFVGGKGSGSKGVELLKKRLDDEDDKKKNSIYFGVLSSSTEKKTSEIITHETKYKEDNPNLSRKVIFSTEVAESSVTIDGLTIVIDSGIVHSSRYYVESNLDALEKRFIPQSSHKQRKGRVGRTTPGTCYNLFTQDQYDNLFPEFATAPIYSDNISGFILDFICQDINYIQFPFEYPKYNKLIDSKLFNQSADKQDDNLEFSELLYELIEPPKSNTVSLTLKRLHTLDCIDIKNNRGYSSIIGRCISSLGISPEMGRLLISSHNYNCRDQMNWFINFNEHFDCKFEKIFISLDNLKSKYFKDKNKDEITEKEIKNLTYKYTNKVKSFSSQYGDIITLINIIQQYKDIRDKLIENEIDQETLDKWIENNYLSKKNIDQILRKNKRDNITKFKDFIDKEYKKNWNIKRSDIFKKPQNINLISEDKDDNLLNCIVDSLLINISHSRNKVHNYYSCFPEIPLEGKIPENRQSLNTFVNYPLGQIKDSDSFMIYIDFKSIFGNRNFNMINLIPKRVLELIIINFKENQENEFLRKQYLIMAECTQIENKIKREHEKQKKIEQLEKIEAMRELKAQKESQKEKMTHKKKNNKPPKKIVTKQKKNTKQKKKKTKRQINT